MEVEIALFIYDMKNFRQISSQSNNFFVDVPPARENESHKMLAIFYRTTSKADRDKGARLSVEPQNPFF
jgi:hypothetical protein